MDRTIRRPLSGMSVRRAFAALLLLALMCFAPARAASDAGFDAAAKAARADLVAKYGDGEAARIDRGVQQVLRYWRPEDGNGTALREFLVEQFVPSGQEQDATFARFEFALERLDGYMTSLVRDFKSGADLDLGPELAVDGLFAGFDPAAHVADDAFRTRVAFAALLNFPETSLEERTRNGLLWSRRQWAETRIAGRFGQRVPGAVQQRIAQASAEAAAYIAGYNIRMHHVLTSGGDRPFPAGMRLLSHWNLRDQIKAEYSDPQGGLERQRLIQLVMEKIVRQEIPKAVIDNTMLDWTPSTGAVEISPVMDEPMSSGATVNATRDREPDTRYRMWLALFNAVRAADPHDPLYPNYVDRSFQREREIPEAQVKELFEAVLNAPVGNDIAKLIAKRLGRPLEPFDIWYAGFRPRAKYAEADLDKITRQKYPTAAAFAADIPRILETLGFSKERAKFLADRIVVEPARGSGHAFGAARRDDAAHLRTRVGAQGMDYKGFNIAVHELGHNCEQVFSTTTIDHTILHGVPNNAFTEAMAFLFQDRDLELLGITNDDPQAQRLAALEQFWAAREIAGVALVDIAAWHWMYAHAEATPAELREAVVKIAHDTWNQYYAPIFGKRDVPLLAIYSHMIDSPLYTPDYPLGHLIAYQVGDHFRKLQGSTFGAEFERLTTIGSITPDAWIRKAVGAPVSADPLINGARDAMLEVK